MSTVAGWVLGISVALTGSAVGFLIGGPIGAGILGVLSLLLAIPFGRAVAQGQPYEGGMGAWRCFLDATWSSFNSWAGAVYYGIHRLTGNTQDTTRSKGKGSIWLTKGVVSKYATTVGTVKAGSNDYIDGHEEIHIFQARLFGPFYIPLVVLNYVLATIIPYWLLFNDRDRYPVTGFASYFENGVYPHVWNELWAYKVSETTH